MSESSRTDFSVNGQIKELAKVVAVQDVEDISSNDLEKLEFLLNIVLAERIRINEGE